VSEATVTVRTPAGMSTAFGIEAEDTATALLERAVGYFVVQGQLEHGGFRLGLLRGPHIIDLAPEDRLLEVGVVDGDVLHLITSEPQVDGA
jgi:hypothetical protein